jgi:hypothetical protein
MSSDQNLEAVLQHGAGSEMGDQEFLRGGNRYVVRTQATGTPSGEFEDREGAISQLSAK